MERLWESDRTNLMELGPFYWETWPPPSWEKIPLSVTLKLRDPWVSWWQVMLMALSHPAGYVLLLSPPVPQGP